jgi:hypothetical protein
MYALISLLAASFIILHAPDGQVIYLNPDQVTNIRKPRGTETGHFARGTNCVVFTTDGKHFATLEICESIRNLLQGSTGKSTSFQLLTPKPNT